MSLTLLCVNSKEGTHVFIDVVGVGSSPYDTLKENKVKVTGVNAASTSKQTDRSKQFGFANMRAELYWKMREALEPGKGDDLALPDDRQLLADLCAPRYSVTARGIMIEGKEDIRRRLGRSPDCGDAAVLAHSQRVVKQYVRFLKHDMDRTQKGGLLIDRMQRPFTRIA